MLKKTIIKCVLEEWSAKEQLLFNEIGLRDWEINPWPLNPQPCPQIQATHTLSSECTFNPINFDDVVDRVGAIKLLKCIPDSVYKVLNRAAKLCIWGFQDWEFFTMSQHYSTMAIETSLKSLLINCIGYPLELKIFDTITKELLYKEDFPPSSIFDDIKKRALKQQKKFK